ncbi:MAG: hypothetical protein QOC72_1216 [Methylobacteriaceae bacterium]|nr:hypothetical protein [Methylobacteriaceae bacterium]
MRGAMQTSRRSFLALVVAASASATSGAAHACAFDGIFDGGFGTIHPRAIEIALAVRAAVADGVLPQSALAPLSASEAGLWRAAETLKRLGHRLSGMRGTAPTLPDIALLCSDVSLWTRYIATAQSFETLVHVSGAMPKDALVITDLAVLTTIVEARLPLRVAVQRGLLIIDAHQTEADAIERLLAAACDEPAPASLDLVNRTPWGPASLR